MNNSKYEIQVVAACCVNKLSPPQSVSSVISKYNLF